MSEFLQAPTESGDPWFLLAAEDLRVLAWLHASERSPRVLIDLHTNGFPSALTLVKQQDPWILAMNQALVALILPHSGHSIPEPTALGEDELAADFAAIYLTHALRASPHESVWRDEDHLMLQEPTFAVRAFYRRHGLQAIDWRQRADDHLVTELEFTATLLERKELKEAARFLKSHLLTWLPHFAARVGQRASTPFYAALAGLTLVACEVCVERLPKVAVIPPILAASSIDSDQDGDCSSSV